MTKINYRESPPCNMKWVCADSLNIIINEIRKTQFLRNRNSRAHY